MSPAAPAVDGLFVPGPPRVVGVVNVTPDSFSDGGRFFDADAAVAYGVELARQGAHVLDIGGESTRPGAQRPTIEEELRRVIPVVAGLVGTGLPVSVDTMRADVAAAALAAGATIVNDVSGGLADPEMVPLVGEAGVPFVAMHWRGHSADMQERAHYDDVVQQVCAELAERRDALVDSGIAPERIVLDPGIGFAKTAEHNWALMGALAELKSLGHPVLVGTSRKAFLGRLGRPENDPRPADDREIETAATSVIAGLAGVWGVRVHDVATTVRALAVVEATQS